MSNHQAIRNAITEYLDRAFEGTDGLDPKVIADMDKLETVRAAIRTCDPELFNWTNKYNSVKSMPSATEDAIIEQIMARTGCSEDEADQMRAWVWNRVF